MEEFENFDIIYDEMNEDYANMEALMSKIYDENPDSELLYSLAEIAQNMLRTQETFIKSYATLDCKDSLLDRVCSKKDALDNAKSKEKSM